MEVITAKDLCKSFKGRKGNVEAVKGLNLCVGQGQIFGFLGPNGAGKTTTMRMLTTLMAPTSGQATVVGFDLFREAGRIREKIGYISQKGGTFELLTGYENLVLQGRLYGLSRDEARKHADRLVRVLHMEEYCHRMVKTYSGGQRRHIDLGMGVMHSPRLLFLDEPTTGLDPTSRAAFWNEILSLREAGITIFLTTHYLDEADSLCDTICIMDHGSVVAEGSGAELKQRVTGDVIEIGMDEAHAGRARELLDKRPDIHEVTGAGGEMKLYVDAGERALPEILALLTGAGIRIDTVGMKKPSLDEVFLKLTGHAIDNGKGEAQ
jgi:ABC-2 type transport system ATP-binding protein